MKEMLVPKGSAHLLTAEELKKWRGNLNWTQRQAAAWLRVPLKAYQKWEQAYRQAHNPGPIKLRMKQARAKDAT